MRAVVLAVLVVLACTLSVSASSADWSAPEALWSSDLSASELEARHSEFLMATDASSTGPANFSSSSSSSSSSSTGGNVITTKPVEVELAIDTSSCASNPNLPQCAFTEAGKGKLADIVTSSFGFPDANLPGEAVVATFTAKNGTVISSSTGAEAVAAISSSSTAAGRRLLQSSGVQASFDFVPSAVDGGTHARKIYSAFTKSIDPSCDTTCQQNIKTTYSLPGPLISEQSVFTTMQQSVVPGSLVVDSDAVQQGNNDAVAASSGDRLVESQGGPRNTNVGYYVLGAVLLAFIVAALIYFIVHKKPVATLVKEEPLRRDEVALAPVVAAPAAHSGVVVAEEQPLAANQQQMDYRSVFALKHNVLDKSAEQKAAEEDEHNHNDVHFILHQ